MFKIGKYTEISDEVARRVRHTETVHITSKSWFWTFLHPDLFFCLFSCKFLFRSGFTSLLRFQIRTASSTAFYSSRICAFLPFPLPCLFCGRLLCLCWSISFDKWNTIVPCPWIETAATKFHFTTSNEVCRGCWKFIQVANSCSTNYASHKSFGHKWWVATVDLKSLACRLYILMSELVFVSSGK